MLLMGFDGGLEGGASLAVAVGEELDVACLRERLLVNGLVREVSEGRETCCGEDEEGDGEGEDCEESVPCEERPGDG